MTGRGQQKRLSGQQQAAARKERKRAYRETSGTTPATIPGTTIPLVIPGTSTRHEQLRQSRRWLGNERRTNPPRFSRSAIEEVEQLFHRDDTIRTNHPFHAVSIEARRIVTTIETERAAAVASGNQGDWWEGESRKGVNVAQQKEFKNAREMLKAAEEGEEERLGLGFEEQEIEDTALGAMTFEDMGLGSRTFDDIGYVSCDDDLADDGDEQILPARQCTESVMHEKAMQGPSEMEGVEQADLTEMDMGAD
ncbi:MAG: hypothetical protein L6R42_008501 [Xanthoria sp. 1 TBL-2021]|nr:MAG: hypothetical protein L6R42_008501 [Xanthoria sp. 1 TBL-2021]